MKQFIVAIIMFTTTLSSNAMELSSDTKLKEQVFAEPKKIFEINGTKKSMAAHIIDAINDQQNLFSVTNLIQYQNDTFIIKGNVTDITPEDLSDIDTGNFIYTPDFTSKKMRFSKSSHHIVGALILGTHDKRIVKKLRVYFKKNKDHQ